MLGPLLDTDSPLTAKTLTVGDDGAGTYGFSSGSFGSLSPDGTYIDRSGNTRTILTIGYNTGTGTFALTLSGSVSNNNSAFGGIIVDGVYLNRADASYNSPSNSNWFWTPGSNIIGTSGVRSVIVV